jgi:hypothetical protein
VSNIDGLVVSCLIDNNDIFMSVKVTCCNIDIGVSLQNKEHFVVTCIYFKR